MMALRIVMESEVGSAQGVGAAPVAGIPFDQIAESMSDGLLCFDRDYRIIHINPAAARLFGYSLSEMRGLSLQALLPPGSRASHDKQVAAFLASGDRSRAMGVRSSVEGLNRDGKRIPLDIAILRLGGDGPGHVAAIVRDRSGKARQEQALRAAHDAAIEANQAKSLFLSGVTHELRTPLNAVIGFAEILAGASGAPVGAARMEEYAGYIAESGYRLLGLISDIIRSARLDAGETEAKEGVFPLREALEEAVLSVDAGSRGRIAIDDGGAGALLLKADRQLLIEALRHGLDNAIRYGGPSCPVRVVARTGGDDLEITIEDEGPGAPDEIIARAGELFHCAGEGERTGRLGLGLFIIRRIMALHDGSMQLRPRPGGGARLLLSLPGLRCGTTEDL